MDHGSSFGDDHCMATTELESSSLTARELALEKFERMAADVTFEEILEELAMLAAIARGQQAAREGRTMSHADFQQQASQWTIK
jgi:predicted transcriptional regulator